MHRVCKSAVNALKQRERAVQQYVYGQQSTDKRQYNFIYSAENCIFVEMRFASVFILILIIAQVYGQGTYIPLGSYSQHVMDRFEIKSGRLATPAEFSTASKSYQRNRIALYIDSFETQGLKLSKQDYFNLAYLQNDNFEFSNSESTRSRAILKHLYKSKAALYHQKQKDFTLVVNPVAYLQAGYDSRKKDLTTLNTRGVEMRGTIGNNIGFFTHFSDEIFKINSWVNDFYIAESVIPGAGFLKTTDGKTFNYGNASGYVVVQANRYIDVQFGHGRNFLGNGYRSLFMSDFSRDHLFLRANTRIWKINYTNIWGQMYNYVGGGQSKLPKRHYYATTYANVNVTKRLNIGLFQTISFQRDSGFSDGGYDLQYLNPVIFYKPIENGLNSPDKALLGLDFKYNFRQHFSVYGQFAISEFVMSNVLARKGWFGNKQAMQLGVKYMDVANISNLDLQLEANIARPYMYTSFNPRNAYVNFNQNMAHPLGANFYEYIGIVRYQPTERLNLKATAIVAIYGNDTNDSNWGRDIRLNYYRYEREFGNTIAQGIRTNLYLADVVASYMLKHNLFIDVQLLYRKTDSELAIFNTETLMACLSFRWNFAERRWDF